MLFRLALLFVLLPLAELALLIQLGQWIGVGWTVAIVAATGLIGAFLARTQGTRALHAIRTELRQGRMPAREMVDGLLILAGGLLLLTPGVLSDITGILLLMPPTRALLQRRLRRRFDDAIRRGDTTFTIMRLP